MQNFNLKQGVYSTLAFFDIFDHPLTLDELSRNILNSDTDKEHIKNYLKETPKIGRYDDFYFLFNQKDIVTRRYYREKLIKKIWKKINRYRFIFEITPFIRGIFVCNTLAFNAYKKDSDIDLFIVTDPKRLFLGRFLLTFLLHLFGLRRHKNKIAGRFCLSFFVTENSLNIGKIELTPYDIYLAYWTKTLISVYDQNEITQKLYCENNYWLNKYFNKISPNFERLKDKRNFLLSLKLKLEKWLGNNFGDKIEEKLRVWQIKRAINKKMQLQNTFGTIVSGQMLKFHDTDKRKLFLNEWKRRMMKLRITN